MFGDLADVVAVFEVVVDCVAVATVLAVVKFEVVVVIVFAEFVVVFVVDCHSCNWCYCWNCHS